MTRHLFRGSACGNLYDLHAYKGKTRLLENNAGVVLHQSGASQDKIEHLIRCKLQGGELELKLV